MKDLVIFCSGFGSPNGIEWKVSPTYQKLRECGYETKIWRNCNSGITDIRHSGKCLSEYIAYKTDDKRTFLIGHSMGGLVARYASYLVRTNGVVTIGTPHLGVPLARWGSYLCKSIEQMAPNSSLLNKLNSAPEPNLYSIRCLFDGMVPFKKSISPMSTKADTVPCSHLTALLSRGVANKISDYIWSINHRMITYL